MLKRKPLNNKPGIQLKRKVLRKKPASPEKIAKDKEQHEKDWVFYNEIWNERGPYSEVSGVYLGKELKSYMIEHLLEKSIYPHLRYEKENIALVTFEEQTLKTNGFPVPKHRELIEKAKQKFNII